MISYCSISQFLGRNYMKLFVQTNLTYFKFLFCPHSLSIKYLLNNWPFNSAEFKWMQVSKLSMCLSLGVYLSICVGENHKLNYLFKCDYALFTRCVAKEGNAINAAPQKRALHFECSAHYVYAAYDCKRRCCLSHARRSCFSQRKLEWHHVWHNERHSYQQFRAKH